MNALMVSILMLYVLWPGTAYASPHAELLPKWVRLLEKGDAQEKKLALGSLWFLQYHEFRKDGNVFQPIANALNDKDPMVREAAAACLAGIGQGSEGCCTETIIVPALVQALRDDNARVRATAARALRYFVDGRAVEPLIEALRDKDAWVRLSAAYALGNQRNYRAEVPLRSLLDDNTDWRYQFAHYEAKRSLTYLCWWIPNQLAREDKNVLAQFPDKSAVKVYLLEKFNDKDKKIRSLAFEALGMFDESDIIDLNVTYLGQKSNDMKYIALRHLRKYFNVLKNPLRNTSDKRRERILLTLIHDNDLIASNEAAAVLGEIGDKRANKPLMKVLKKELEKQKKPGPRFGDNGLKHNIVAALVRSAEPKKSDAELTALLIETIRNNEEDPGLKQICIITLGKMQDRRAVPALKKITLDKDVSHNAALALGEIGDPAALDVLENLLYDKEKEGIHDYVIMAIGKIYDARSVDILLKFLSAKRGSYLDLAVLNSLGKQKSKRAMRPILRITGEGSGYQAFDYYAAAAFKAYNEPSMLEMLFSFLNDRDKRVKKGAVIVLGEFRDQKGIDRLKKMTDDPDPEIRTCVQKALRLNNISLSVQ